MTFRYATRLRRPLLPALVVFTMCGLTAACGSEPRACSDCPPLAGRWALTYDDLPALSAQCEEMQIPRPDGVELNLTQSGSGLHGTLEGVELGGTAWDTWDFSLNGNARGDDGGTVGLSLTGRYGPGVADGGGFVGTYTANHTRDGRSCMFSRGYTAARVP
jgi:hypothetical protein